MLMTLEGFPNAHVRIVRSTVSLWRTEIADKHYLADDSWNEAIIEITAFNYIKLDTDSSF